MKNHQLPDPSLAQGSSRPVTIFHAHTREEYNYPEHKTPYLLVSNFGCRGDYILNGETVQASDQLFYFANEGDELEICFRNRSKRETLLMIFDRQTFREAAAAWLLSPEALLENMHAEALCECKVPTIPFKFTDEFRRLIEGVRGQNTATDAHGLPERVLTGFFKVWSEASDTMRKVPVVSAAARWNYINV